MFERRRHRYIYRDIDRHGTVRLYFRRTDHGQKVRMPDDPSSEEFAVRYKELCGDASATLSARKEPSTSAYRWLVDEYLRSGAFKRLDKLTQDKRRQLIDASPAGDLTFLVTSAGAPYTVWGLRQLVPG